MRPICLQDLEFEEVQVERRSTSGVPYDVWMRVGMPRIPRNAIDCVFYLYASREDALAGKHPGGTGFIVDYREPFGRPRQYHQLYGVTNWHVACRDGFSVVRLNRKDGGVDVVDLGPDEWEFVPGRYDVAVTALSLDEEVHSTLSIPLHLFLEGPAPHPMANVGVGDDAFMIGLFVDHDGTTRNVPSARFGNISTMPNPAATIEQPNGYRGVSYVVDLHSRPGFSGSPVFVYRTFGSELTPFMGRLKFEELEIDTLPPPRSRVPTRFRTRGSLKVKPMFRFLGIHWGQFREEWELRQGTEMAEARKAHLVAKGTYVEGMSGMSCVIPSWEIKEVLDMPKLKGRRDKAQGLAAEDFSVPVAESATRAESEPPTKADNPTHAEDFRHLLNAAAKTQTQDDET